LKDYDDNDDDDDDDDDDYGLKWDILSWFTFYPHFRIRHQEGPRISGGSGNEWDISAFGRSICRWWLSVKKHGNHK